MSHDIEVWSDEEQNHQIMPRLNKNSKKVAAAYFEAFSVPLAQKICEDIYYNYDNPDARVRGEAKEMLVKMKDKIFQNKAAELPTSQDQGEIDGDTSNALLNFIQQKRLLDTSKGQVKENEDGATFCN